MAKMKSLLEDEGLTTCFVCSDIERKSEMTSIPQPEEDYEEFQYLCTPCADYYEQYCKEKYERSY